MDYEGKPPKKCYGGYNYSILAILYQNGLFIDVKAYKHKSWRLLVGGGPFANSVWQMCCHTLFASVIVDDLNLSQRRPTGWMAGSRRRGGTIFCLIGRSGDQTDGEATDAKATAGGCD